MATVKDFPCSSDGMIAAQAFLESVCDAPKPAIIMDEIVSNIVRCSGATGFSVDLEREPESIKMVFSDDGKAFDPIKEVADPTLSSSIEERGIGGLGIFMVKKMSKTVDYVRRDGRNVLTVVLPA